MGVVSDAKWDLRGKALWPFSNPELGEGEKSIGDSSALPGILPARKFHKHQEPCMPNSVKIERLPGGEANTLG